MTREVTSRRSPLDALWNQPGLGEGRRRSRWVRLGGSGLGTVFDVNTGHVAQDRATVYVFLSLTCRGGDFLL